MENDLEYDPRRKRRSVSHRRVGRPRVRTITRYVTRRRHRRLDPGRRPLARTRMRRAFGRAKRPALSVMDAVVGLLVGGIGYGLLNYAGKQVDIRYPPPQ